MKPVCACLCLHHLSNFVKKEKLRRADMKMFVVRRQIKAFNETFKRFFYGEAVMAEFYRKKERKT